MRLIFTWVGQWVKLKRWSQQDCAAVKGFHRKKIGLNVAF